MKKALILTLTIGLMFAVFSTVFADSRDQIANDESNAKSYTKPQDNKGPFHRGKRFRQFMIRELGLSENQQSKMKDMGKSFRDKIREDRKAVRKIREEKLQMLQSGKVDMNRFKELDGQFMKHHTRIDQERLKMKRERLTVLNSDQIKKLGELLEKRKQRFAERFKKRGFGSESGDN